MLLKCHGNTHALFISMTKYKHFCYPELNHNWELEGLGFFFPIKLFSITNLSVLPGRLKVHQVLWPSHAPHHQHCARPGDGAEINACVSIRWQMHCWSYEQWQELPKRGSKLAQRIIHLSWSLWETLQWSWQKIRLMAMWSALAACNSLLGNLLY